MAAQYTEITFEDMEQFLKRAFRALRPHEGEHGGEVFFDLLVSDHVAIRVFTSISKRRGQGAGVGEDAIRILLYSRKQSRPLMKGKAPIVKRTQGWRNSLQERIEDALEVYEDREAYWEERAGGEATRKEEAPPPPDSVQGPPPSAPAREGPSGAATFTKLRDNTWGLRGYNLIEGSSVTVAKRDGSKSVLQVGKVVWRGPDGTCLAQIAESSRRYASDLDESTEELYYGTIPS
jgi:hypothetical protein